MVSIVFMGMITAQAQVQTPSLVLLPQQPSVLSSIPVKLGQPIYAGNGCPQQTAEFISDGDSQFFLLTDRFVADSSQGNSRLLRTSCNLRVPLEVQAGYKIGFQYMNSDLFVELRNQNSTAQVTQIIGLVGQKQITEKKRWTAPRSGSDKLTSSITNNVVWSTSCGQSAILSLNTNILLTTMGRGDFVEIPQLTRVKLVVRRCK